jgi:hypothetical protein
MNTFMLGKTSQCPNPKNQTQKKRNKKVKGENIRCFKNNIGCRWMKRRNQKRNSSGSKKLKKESIYANM